MDCRQERILRDLHDPYEVQRLLPDNLDGPDGARYLSVVFVNCIRRSHYDTLNLVLPAVFGQFATLRGLIWIYTMRTI
jgi:hypothetical protein